MATAPNGRVLSPGEVIEEHTPAPQAEEWQEDLNVVLVCPDCKDDPPHLVEEFSSGDLVCGSCGLVLSGRLIDTRSEWRTFSNDDQGNDDPSRVGDAANPLLNGAQLQTNIAYGDNSGRNRELHRAQNKANHDKSTKSLLAAYKQIGAYCDAAQFGHAIAETAKHLYKMTDDAKIFKGKPQEVVIAGCIFVACRQNGAGRSFREIYAMTRVSKKEIGRIFKALDKFIAEQSQKGAKVTAGGTVVRHDYKPTESTKADELTSRFCNKLGLSNQAAMMVQELATRVNEKGVIAGRSPLSAAAACIYMVSYLIDTPKTPKQIAEVVSVSDGTIRTVYKSLYENKEELISESWLKKGADVSRLPPV